VHRASFPAGACSSPPRHESRAIISSFCDLKLLDLSFDEILLGQPTVRLPGKRGPASRLEQQIDAIARLPKAEQRAVSTVLTAVLAQHGAQIGQEAATA